MSSNNFIVGCNGTERYSNRLNTLIQMKIITLYIKINVTQNKVLCSCRLRKARKLMTLLGEFMVCELFTSQHHIDSIPYHQYFYLLCQQLVLYFLLDLIWNSGKWFLKDFSVLTSLLATCLYFRIISNLIFKWD